MRLKAYAATLLASLVMVGVAAPAVPAHAANVAVGVEIGPRSAPPRLRYERRPPRPHPGWAWHNGYWAWRDGNYVWVDGTWVNPPRRGAYWVAGHWAHRHGRWVWIEGHWR